MVLTSKQIVHNVVTSGKNDDGVRAIDEKVRQTRLDRDRLWCRAIVHALDGDAKQINAVMNRFNETRPDKRGEPMPPVD